MKINDHARWVYLWHLDIPGTPNNQFFMVVSIG